MSDRQPDESPVDYHKRTGEVPDDWMEPFMGRFYQRPDIAYRFWMTREARDAYCFPPGGEG